ncbi:hypothetical protein ACLGI4_01945 [Streptomyces sp. HMX112]|uniref:hypothetical protein n=1 Tax=Streptomyces sp. HMX112 TaxID=3390850 RepID=UPI003A811E96
MWSTHHVIVDGTPALGADELPCPFCASLFSPGATQDRAAYGPPPTARKPAADPLTGAGAVRLRAVTLRWCAAAVAVTAAVVLAIPHVR